jgi:predicted DsbA family dithiol-disulfide isomerase
MVSPLRIDFVSDVTCPWCAIGLRSLERAIGKLGNVVPVGLHLQPFELNPGMPHDGEPIADYAARKYGAGADALAARQALIRERGIEVGYDFRLRTHVYNTFDAHRLLHWAGLEGKALDLKRALFVAYHCRGDNPALHDVLLGAAVEVGLDVERARGVLASETYAAEVRVSVRRWQQLGIASVPSVIVNRRRLIQGGQTFEAYERSLRQIADEERRLSSPA